ncbi:MAG: hypothetical protein K9I94_07820 [Bacteroidales bacterium]|nr:hypothetical protein [Bacteroidales bacterium]
MTTIENIKHRLIDRILATNNEKFLQAIENVFITSQNEDIINISNEEMEMLKMSEDDIKKGNITSESDLDNMDEKWLH